jgi:GTP:adenosylcobinamide-phosphate guanylyltransferase
MLDAVVMAGFDPDRPDLLVAATNTPQKAFIDVAGRPLVWWTVQALRRCPLVGRIAIVGIDPELPIDLGEDVERLANVPDHLENVVRGINHLLARQPEMEHCLIVSSDLPLLRPETVTWFTERCLRDPDDLFYPVVQDTVMEAAFPGSNRSYVRVKEGRFCGGDIFLIRTVVLQANLDLIRQLTARRKNALKQARLFGLTTLVKIALGRLSIAEGEQVASRLLQCRARVIPTPYADIGMDVDKPHQLEMARRLLAPGAA